MNSNYFKKYFKYKNKYLLLKNKLGGSQFTIPTYSEELVNKFTDFLNLTCNQLQNADNLKDIDDEVINEIKNEYKLKDSTNTELKQIFYGNFTMKTIAYFLNENNILNRNKQWTSTSVNCILDKSEDFDINFY